MDAALKSPFPASAPHSPTGKFCNALVAQAAGGPTLAINVADSQTTRGEHGPWPA